MAVTRKEFTQKGLGNLDLAVNLISKNILTGNRTFLPAFSDEVSAQLVSGIFKSGKGLAPIEAGIFGDSLGLFHFMNLKVALFSISDTPKLPNNIRSAIRESVTSYNPENIIRGQGDIGIFAKVIDKKDHDKILTAKSYDLSPKWAVPPLMGDAWQRDVSIRERLDYVGKGVSPITTNFFKTHNVIVTTLPIEPQYDPDLLRYLTEMHLPNILERLNKGSRPKDFKPEDFKGIINLSQKDLEMAIYLISSAFSKAAKGALIGGGVKSADLLPHYLSEISHNTNIILEEELKKDKNKELVVMFSYKK